MTTTDTTTPSTAAPDWGTWDPAAFTDALAHLDDPARERITLAEGDTFAGVIDAFVWLPSDHGPFPLAECREYPSGREVSLAVGRTALRRQLARAQAQPGDLLAVKYRGLATGDSGREYHDYSVRVGKAGPRRPGDVFREDPPADWDLLQDEPGDLVPEGDPADVPF